MAKRIMAYGLAFLVLIFSVRVNANQTGPGLVWSSYLGGAGFDRGKAVTQDAQGNLLIFGETQSTDFPADHRFGTPGNTHLYVTKMKSDGTIVLWSLLIAGSRGEMAGKIAIDSSGDIYLAGMTSSLDFPVTAGASDTTPKGGMGIFVANIAPDGSALLWSTFVGGTKTGKHYSEVGALLVAPDRQVIMAGKTGTTDFPVTPDAFSTTFKQGTDWWLRGADLFLVKIQADGSLFYAIYYGGTNHAQPAGFALAGEQVYIVGSTQSEDLPVTVGAYDTRYGGG